MSSSCSGCAPGWLGSSRPRRLGSRASTSSWLLLNASEYLGGAKVGEGEDTARVIGAPGLVQSFLSLVGNTSFSTAETLLKALTATAVAVPGGNGGTVLTPGDAGLIKLMIINDAMAAAMPRYHAASGEAQEKTSSASSRSPSGRATSAPWAEGASGCRFWPRCTDPSGPLRQDHAHNGVGNVVSADRYTPVAAQPDGTIIHGAVYGEAIKGMAALLEAS